jgi:hypothetical protein
MKNKTRVGIAVLLTSIMVLSIFAILPSAAATSSYTWRDYEYPIQPKKGTALQYKMSTVDFLYQGQPSIEYYISLGIFNNDFLVSYKKITEFLYRSCNPDIWWYQDEMLIYPQMYGNYPGDSLKSNPQSAVSQGKKVFQDEYVVIVEMNNEIRELEDAYATATGLEKLIINSMLMGYKMIRNDIVISDMVMAYHILDFANSASDAIINSNGKVDLSGVGGPTNFELQHQQQILKWTKQANDDFDDGVSGLALSPSVVRGKIDTNKESHISGMLSSNLDASAYTTGMKYFEKTISKSGHALAVSGGLEFCLSSFAMALPAAVGIILCFGIVVQRRRRKA